MPKIHIALTFDDRYWAPAYATMRSVCLSTKRKRDLVFHLYHRTLSPGHEETLHRIAAEFGAALVFCNIDQNVHFQWLMAKAPENKRLTNICYARLLFAETLPTEVARVVYLDCDTMMRAPIERIAEMDLDGNALAAVADFNGLGIMTNSKMVDTLGIFDPGMRYFNAGLLVVDVEKWREAEVIKRFETMLNNGILAKIYYDQDFLNLIFEDRWLELPVWWNLLDPRPWHESLNPYLCHYTGNLKPWLIRPKVAYARTYRYVMTTDVYYRYLAERCPQSLRPMIMWLKRYNGDFAQSKSINLKRIVAGDDLPQLLPEARLAHLIHRIAGIRWRM